MTPEERLHRATQAMKGPVRKMADSWKVRQEFREACEEYNEKTKKGDVTRRWKLC